MERGLMGIPGVIRFMVAGSLQLVLYTPAFLVLRALNKPAYVKYLAKTARGLGKILWWDSLSPKLYGAATLKTPAQPKKAAS